MIYYEDTLDVESMDDNIYALEEMLAERSPNRLPAPLWNLVEQQLDAARAYALILQESQVLYRKWFNELLQQDEVPAVEFPPYIVHIQTIDSSYIIQGANRKYKHDTEDVIKYMRTASAGTYQISARYPAVLAMMLKKDMETNKWDNVATVQLVAKPMSGGMDSYLSRIELVLSEGSDE